MTAGAHQIALGNFRFDFFEWSETSYQYRHFQNFLATYVIEVHRNGRPLLATVSTWT